MNKIRTKLEEIGLPEAFPIWENRPEGHDESIVIDIVSKLERRDLTEKQVNYLGTLLGRIAASNLRKSQWAAESANAGPIPVTAGEKSRMTISGEIVSLKFKDYQGSWKMVVRADDGWKVYGSLPASIREQAQVGNYVRFTGTVTVSEKDPAFGFFSRPSKAVIIGQF
jgi:hypothetical protein